jgi:hypothetical protein
MTEGGSDPPLLCRRPAAEIVAPSLQAGQSVFDHTAALKILDVVPGELRELERLSFRYRFGS